MVMYILRRGCPPYPTLAANCSWTWGDWNSTINSLPLPATFAQDAKLHTLRWHLLPRLGAALLPLARLAGAPEYADHYLRDLGPGCAPLFGSCISLLREGCPSFKDT